MPRSDRFVLLALGTLGAALASPYGGYGSKGPADPWTPDPWPTEHRPADPWTPDPWPADPWTPDPWPTEPWPADPWPVDPWPADPWPADPRPVDPWPADPWPADPSPVDPWPAEPPGHVGPYGPVKGGGGYGHVDRYGPVHSGGGYGHVDRYGPVHSGGGKCHEGFYGQCKKDQWGQCINPDFVGVWEFTEDPYGHQSYNKNRWLLQVDEYDFCKQSGNYRVTNGKGLTESDAYGTYIWADKNLFKMRDYSYVFQYKYPHGIAGTVVWDSDVSLDGYGENGWTVQPAVGITKDLYGEVIDKEFSPTTYKKLEGPSEGYGY